MRRLKCWRRKLDCSDWRRGDFYCIGGSPEMTCQSRAVGPGVRDSFYPPGARITRRGQFDAWTEGFPVVIYPGPTQ